METNKCYGYVRVSTSDQDGSLENQEKKIIEYCKFKNLDLVEIFIDSNVSGFKEFKERPEGGRLLGKLNGVRAIVAIKIDRLFRNTIDALTTVNKWDAMDIDLHIVDMGGVSLSTKNAVGKMVFTQIVSFAQYERDITGERTKAILSHKKSTGKAYCGSVYGFDNVSGQLVRNESEQETLRLMLSLRQGGRTYAEIADNLLNEGKTAKSGKPLTAAVIRNLCEKHKGVILL